MKKEDLIYIAGHRGLVGSALVRQLQAQGFNNLVLKTRAELDLTNQLAVSKFFQEYKPQYVFLAAAKVGGILANSQFKADFIRDNLLIQTFIMDSAYKNSVKKLLFLGSSCIYPRDCQQPIKESYFLSGYLEKTNDAYAIAKIAGIMMAQAYKEQFKANYIALMPTNLYGQNDNFDLETSHVLPAMLHKFHLAKLNKQKTVTLWGSGSPKREFLYVDDLAKAAIFLMQNYNEAEIVNVGTGLDISIYDLAILIKEITGFSGEIIWDTSKPDGTPRKLLDVSKLNKLGFRAQTSLKEGIIATYKWFTEKREL